MSISAVSGKGNAAPAPLSDNNNAVNLLERQKSRLQEKIQKFKESKMDEKLKQETIKQVQDQIDQLDSDILRLRMEKLTQGQNATQSTNENTNSKQEAISGQPSDVPNGSTGNLPDMSSLLKASATYSKAKIFDKANDNLKKTGNVIKMEIAIDESRGVTAQGKVDELRKIESRESPLGGKTLETAHNAMKQAKSEGAVEDNGKLEEKTEEGFQMADTKEIEAEERSRKKIDLMI